MSHPQTSVVILNWNTRGLLERFLPEVIKNSREPGVEIVVADNGSTDGSVPMLQKKFPEVRIVQLEKNFGFAGGYNRILQQIKTPYTLLLNSDVAPGADWLPPLIQCMEDQPEIAACVPKIKSAQNPEMFEYAGAAGGFIDKLGYTFCRGRIFDTLEKDHGQYNASTPVFWASGAALMVRTREYVESGGLNEHFFAHMEEIDWCWRMKNQGKTIQYIPRSTIFHLGGGTLNALSPRKNFLNFRNNLYMLYRNLPEGKVWGIILQRILMDYLAAVRFLASGKSGHFWTIIQAHNAFFRNMSRLKKERNQLKQKVTRPNHPETYTRSIVFDYFFKDRKYFSSLKFSNFPN